jgi:hypothetical protein
MITGSALLRAAISAAWLGTASAASAGGPQQLTDRQLDAVNAGLGATGSADATADGQQASTSANVFSGVAQDSPAIGRTFGTVTASTFSPGGGASATSTLSLTLSVP